MVIIGGGRAVEPPDPGEAAVELVRGPLNRRELADYRLAHAAHAEDCRARSHDSRTTIDDQATGVSTFVES